MNPNSYEKDKIIGEFDGWLGLELIRGFGYTGIPPKHCRSREGLRIPESNRMWLPYYATNRHELLGVLERRLNDFGRDQFLMFLAAKAQKHPADWYKNDRHLFFAPTDMIAEVLIEMISGTANPFLQNWTKP
jgi:hypothetical protein